MDLPTVSRLAGAVLDEVDRRRRETPPLLPPRCPRRAGTVLLGGLRVSADHSPLAASATALGLDFARAQLPPTCFPADLTGSFRL